MNFVSFIVALVLSIIAACLFGRGLVLLNEGNQKASGLISSSFLVGLLVIIIPAILFGFYNL
jgi:Na+/H+ antiporter NhaC